MNPKDNVPTHGIDVSNLTRTGERRKLEDEEKVFQVKDLNLFYGEKQALHNINMAIKTTSNRIHRPQRLRQVHLAALFEPHE